MGSGEKTPITWGFLKTWLPAVVTAVSLLVTGVTAWVGLNGRVATLETKAEVQAKIEPQLAERFRVVESLLVEMICTQQPQDPERCRRATRIVGGGVIRGD